MLTVSDQVEQELKERLMEIREDANTIALCKHDPEKWLTVAVAVYRGEPIRRVTAQYNIGQSTYYRVRKDILDIQNKYVEFQLSQIDANIDAADSATEKTMQIVNEMLDDAVKDKSVRSLEHSSIVDKYTRADEANQKKAVSLAMRKGKLLDKPDIVVEQRGPEIKNYEDYLRELKIRLKNEKQAEAIDITEEE